MLKRAKKNHNFYAGIYFIIWTNDCSHKVMEIDGDFYDKKKPTSSLLCLIGFFSSQSTIFQLRRSGSSLVEFAALHSLSHMFKE